MRVICLIVVLSMAGFLDAAELISAGKPCAFSPAPNYADTAAGGTDTSDLTDSLISRRKDQAIWFEKQTVAWSYCPIINIRVDLQAIQPIDQVVIRLLGGSAQAGFDFPAFVKLLVSDDDITWYPVAEYSRWTSADDARYGIPATEGKSWVYPLRFADLKTRGRYVGFVLGGSGFTCTDELYVYRGDHDPAKVSFNPSHAVDFSVSRPQITFLKPSLILTRNIATPQPFCLLDGSGIKRDVTLHIQTPQGVRVLAGNAGSAKVHSASGGDPQSLTTGVSGESILPWGEFFVQSDLPDGSPTQLRCWLEWDGGQSLPLTIPATVVDVPPAPNCNRMMMAQGWWHIASTRNWPDGLNAAKIIGINTLSTFTMNMKMSDSELWDYTLRTRAEGFKMLNIGSTWHKMMSNHPDKSEYYCQFSDGTTGHSFCPSYRGELYAQELKRVADECARLKPDYLSDDIELWNWQGPKDSEKCTRCRLDKQKSGIESWEQWKLAKGYEMWKDLHDAVQSAVKKAGGPYVEMGLYDARPGKAYQFFWPFDRLYADKLIHNAQPSVYTSLLPYDIELIGNEVRHDRSLMNRTDIIPWLTSGDAGAFSAENMRCAMLECFLNGSRGIQFWSSRYWDGEYFVGYNQAVRAVAAAQDIIVDGALYDGARVDRPTRVSGMIHNSDIALLVADYYGSGPTAVNVSLTVPVASDMIDSESGKKLGELPAGPQTAVVNLDVHRSRVILIKARE